MYICLCNGITDGQIRREIRAGACTSFSDLQGQLGVALQCGKCACAAVQVLEEELCACRSIPACGLQVAAA